MAYLLEHGHGGGCCADQTPVSRLNLRFSTLGVVFSTLSSEHSGFVANAQVASVKSGQLECGVKM
jgi:hypothetical protein